MGDGALMVQMPYIGGVLSVNHYKIPGTYRTRPEVSAWMEALGLQMKLLINRTGAMVQQPPTIMVSGRFCDRRSTPDLANLHKVIGDALEGVIGDNDREFRFVDEGYQLVKALDPLVIIRVAVNYPAVAVRRVCAP